METVSWIFRTRWILWGATPLLALSLLPQLQAQKVDLHQFLERHFHKTLLFTCTCFFVLAALSKESQYASLALSAEDFWLFADMLRQINRGGIFLTRFAPQGIGWVQHGVVHPFFTWMSALPLSWMMGPVHASLLIMPILFAAAGFLLGILCKPKWGASSALLIAFLFLASSQVGRVLTYEVHPEAAYPCFVFLWLWGFSLKNNKLRVLVVFLATVGGMGIKEDAFLVFFPLIGAFMIGVFMIWPPDRPHPDKSRWLSKTAFVSFLVAIAVSAFQIHAIHQWKNQAWGPLEWQGSPVIVPEGPRFLQGIHWDSFGSTLKILNSLISSGGGITGTFTTLATFLTSRPWISLIGLAPWVIFDWTFWIVILPLATATALLGGSISTFVNYYSAPFLGLFWTWAVISPAKSKQFSQQSSPGPLNLLSRLKKKRFQLYWMTVAVFLWGSGGLNFYFPSEFTHDLKKEIEQLKPCLEKSSGPGLVATPLIGWVPQDKIWTERLPIQKKDWDSLHFVLLLPKRGSFEFPLEQVQKTISQLEADPHWTRCGSSQNIVFYLATGEKAWNRNH